MLTEMVLDIDHEAIEVIIYGHNDYCPCDLSKLSIEDQLIIIKAVAENH